MAKTDAERKAEREKADKFVAAVAAGSKVYAHPETARLMREFIGEIEDCEWMKVGSMYAVDFGMFKAFDPEIMTAPKVEFKD